MNKFDAGPEPVPSPAVRRLNGFRKAVLIVWSLLGVLCIILALALVF